MDVSDIREFLQYLAVKWTPTRPLEIIFKVRCLDGTTTVFECPLVIRTKFPDLEKVRHKVSAAKKLIWKEEWDHIWEKYGVSQDAVMQVVPARD